MQYSFKCISLEGTLIRQPHIIPIFTFSFDKGHGMVPINHLYEIAILFEWISTKPQIKFKIALCA